ncbi:MAG TPA: glutamine-hydrolyzing GMP synthase [Bryobacteraceae bacterium]|nr:glutamine-hydrolyzing GMP synthase [Bryobacteraceae bacterium]
MVKEAPLTQIKVPQITVLDAGGQYCHLIARKVRDLGVYAEVRPSETPAADLAGRRGLIISGGPSSVYDRGSATVDPAIFSASHAVLGICYGQQLMAHLLGGVVQKGEKGEYGLATLELNGGPKMMLFSGLPERQQVWMSHFDVVTGVPPGFAAVGKTSTCAIAAMAAPARGLYAVQFHPEVVHTTEGSRILANFLFDVCGCEKDWDPRHRVPLIEDEIRRTVGERNVFFFVSGGVDSTVAFSLCLRTLGPGRVRGIYVDTGLMREGETEFVGKMFESLGAGTVSVEHVEQQFLTPLAGVRDPEQKRQIIGEEFVRVQERIIESRHLLDGHWILGQGTIYPDTIESGGTEKAAVIKTHHNRVAGIQQLIAAKRIVEPLSSFYKDEVREIGRELGISEDVLERHPFPGPGLAIRCLCAEHDEPVSLTPDGSVLPVRSVGVQGDERSYRPILALDRFPTADNALQNEATELINRLRSINRVVTRVAGHVPLGEMHVFSSTLSPDRLDRLRRADAIVRRRSHESGFDKKVWQFPVVLIPVGSAGRQDSVVLRPIDSVDGMTAQSVSMEEPLLRSIAAELLEIEGICGVFYDLTHKPPATIEWE